MNYMLPFAAPRNPLVYPAGRGPRFDSAHPAARGISGIHGFSAVATSDGMVNLVTGSGGTPTLTGGAFFSTTRYGPALIWPTSTTGQSVKFAGTLSHDTAMTLGFIGTLTSTSGWLISTDGVGAEGGQLRPSSTTALDFTMPAVASVNSGTMSVPSGDPLFVVASKGPSSINFLCLDLQTGKVTTSAVASVQIPNAPTTAGMVVGSAGVTGSPSGFCAAAMFSPIYLSMQLLLAWAADPWSFWYPRSKFSGGF